MALKKYTLYFKGKSKSNRKYDLPILSLDLKKMDEYTSNYVDYNDLFNSLPSEVKDYINEKLNNNVDLSSAFFITDEDYNPIMDVIFEDGIDVTYITPKEVENLIISEKMTYEEYQSLELQSKEKENINAKYEFFKYLYETYVKDTKMEGMIDDYDAKRIFANAPYDDIMISSIACDKDNIMVLCKKLSQEFESRRNLALKFHKLFNINEPKKMITNELVIERKNKDLDIESIYMQIIDNLNEFKKGKRI